MNIALTFVVEMSAQNASASWAKISSLKAKFLSISVPLQSLK